eukprot:932676-Rhodomonas_salina.1
MTGTDRRICVVPKPAHCICREEHIAELIELTLSGIDANDLQKTWATLRTDPRPNTCVLSGLQDAGTLIFSHTPFMSGAQTWAALRVHTALTVALFRSSPLRRFAAHRCVVSQLTVASFRIPTCATLRLWGLCVTTCSNTVLT